MVDIEKIRESLIAQLRVKHSDVEVFREQIDSYCRFTKFEDELWDDIEKRGRTIVVTAASSGKKCEKENPSIKNVVMMSKQRTDILKKLGLNIDSIMLESDVNSDI